MHARVSRFRTPLDRLDEDIRQTAEIAPEVESMPGSYGIYYAVDRETGQTMAFTLWESEQAMRDSEEAVRRIREKSVADTSAEILSVEHYEIVWHPSRLKVEEPATR